LPIVLGVVLAQGCATLSTNINEYSPFDVYQISVISNYDLSGRAPFLSNIRFHFGSIDKSNKEVSITKEYTNDICCSPVKQYTNDICCSPVKQYTNDIVIYPLWNISMTYWLIYNKTSNRLVDLSPTPIDPLMIKSRDAEVQSFHF